MIPRPRPSGLRFLVVGSLNADYILHAGHLPEDDGSTTVRVVTAYGGHAGNCAGALARLGASAAVLGAVGDDADGTGILADLTALGVTTRHVRRCAAPTGRVFIPTSPTKRYMLMERGANAEPTPADLAAVDPSEVNGVLVFDPPRAVIEAVAAWADGAARRPLLCWNPGGIYSSPEFLPLARGDFDTVVVNRDEHRLMYGKAIARPGHEWVLTRGAAGSALLEPEFAEEPAFALPAVDPTGAGDAFCAALAVARLSGLAPHDRLRFANAVGGLATLGPGARGALPTLDEALACADKRPSSRAAR
ncbi:PfkB family carbohydrate kinase [Spongiactinospora sp. TRM90649]|uniref:carbohydrate kinase family protein n=1 Tax=Spongiactinospora sp. TRM90649 TaxID=3031114 RepID=UPI0023F69535|nr:PfkB family carbohydrate kinase [Spongiactinospora sp. TRM90649]MDF5751643.1 PfkB family carbohydrate kinase [Spongiactinospora sp. TRM90649]